MNDFVIEFKPTVYYEIQEAIDYYDSKSDGLGIRFLKSLSKKIETLKVNPFYQTRYKTVKITTIDSFPYLIHFQVFESTNKVLILAVLHSHINPNKWLK